ncbi:MAG: DinB family protein [Bacteroidota bacterium]|nr:DinB family protein [Bacteroidota bacterium]
MSLQKLMTNYAAYNLWANQSLVEWLRTKPAELFKAEVPSSFSSILKTFNHILAVQEFWYSVVNESELKTNRYGATEMQLEEVIADLIAQSNALGAYVNTLSEKELEKKVHLDTPWVKGEMPRYEFLQHVFNHSTYHRGQIITIGRNIGLTDAPMTDYNFFNMAVEKSVA